MRQQYLRLLLLAGLPSLTLQSPVVGLTPRDASIDFSGLALAKRVQSLSSPAVNGDAFRLLGKRQSDNIGRWALRALTCPAGLAECESGPKATNACCPEDLYCVGYAFRVACCPTEDRCDEPAFTFPACADPTWSLWESEDDGYFCCLGDQKGFINTNGGGSCGPGNLQLEPEQVASSAVPYGGSGGPEATNSVGNGPTSIGSSDDTATETGTSEKSSSGSDSGSGGGGLGKGTLIGIIVGAIVGIILIGLVVFFAVKHGVKKGRIAAEKEVQRQNQNNQVLSQPSNTYIASPPPPPDTPGGQQPPQDIKYAYTGVVQAQPPQHSTQTAPYSRPQGHHEIDGQGRPYYGAEMDGQGRM